MNYKIVTDSSSNLTDELIERFDLTVVPLMVITETGEYPSYVKGQKTDLKPFYDKLRAHEKISTSCANADAFRESFEQILQSGNDVLCVAFSSGLSATYNAAKMAADELSEKYPSRTIRVVDSLSAALGEGLLVYHACELKEQGKSLTEVADWLEENKLKLHHWFFSTDLTSYVRGGRISKTAAVFGGLLEICPLLNMDNLGRLIPRSKIRTKKRVIKEIVSRMEQHVQDGHDYSGKCYISNSACYDDARAVADLVEEKFPKLNGKVEINHVGTTIGSHTGPGTVALFFWGDERTE